jgi:hypothetical protein
MTTWRVPGTCMEQAVCMQRSALVNVLSKQSQEADSQSVCWLNVRQVSIHKQEGLKSIYDVFQIRSR